MADFGSDYAKGVDPVVQAITYSVGAVMGGLLTFPVFRGPDICAGKLTNVLLVSRKGNVGGYTVYLFDNNPVNSTITDATALVLSSLDVGKLANNPMSITLSVPAGTSAALGQATPTTALSVSSHSVPPSVNLYAAVVANTVISCTVGDLFLRLAISQD